MKICRVVFLVAGMMTSSFSFGEQADWIGKLNPIERNLSDSIYIFVPNECQVCIKQIIDISFLKKEIPSVQIKIVTKEKNQAFTEYMSAFSLKADIITDTFGEYLSKLSITTIPTYIFVDRRSVIKGFYSGNFNRKEIINFGNLLVQSKNLPAVTPLLGIGKEAPKDVSINFKDHKKNWVIFHNSSCPYSLKQLPNLLEYAKNKPSEKFFLVAFGNEEDIESQFAEAPKNIEVLPVGDTNFDLANKYTVNATPTQILVSDTGRVTYRGEGYTDEDSPFLPK